MFRIFNRAQYLLLGQRKYVEHLNPMTQCPIDFERANRSQFQTKMVLFSRHVREKRDDGGGGITFPTKDSATVDSLACEGFGLFNGSLVVLDLIALFFSESSVQRGRPLVDSGYYFVFTSKSKCGGLRRSKQ